MSEKILISFIIIFLSGCASQQESVKISDIKEENESLKMEVPEYVPAGIKGLESFDCDELLNICTMTIEDGRQMEYDRNRMYQYYRLDHDKDVELVKAYNRMIDYKSHSEYMVVKLKLANQEIEQALKEERTFNAVKTWAERIAFIFGIWAFGNL